MIDRYRIKVSALFFLLLSLYGCHREAPDDHIRLQRAESMARFHADSAMKLLRAIKQPEKMPAADYAQYALCYNEAAWHLNLGLLSAPLASVAVTYFTQKRDNDKAAAAFFLLSKVKEAENDPSARAEALMQAETVAKESGNRRILGLVYEEKGLIFFDQDDDSSSITV